MLQRRALLLSLPAAGLAGLTARPVRALAAGAAALQPGDAVDTSDYLRMVTGVRYKDEPRGTGAEPRKGQKVTVNYTGWIFEDPKIGKKFDASADHGGPFSFVFGSGQVIPGWDQGVSTMHVGGTRIMILPSRLAYGEKGAGSVIPPNATLIFQVDLLSIG